MRTDYKNGWGVSIIGWGRGSENGLFELAVYKDGRMHYDNPVAQGDTRGWLTDDKAMELAELVASWSSDQVFLDEEE